MGRFVVDGVIINTLTIGVVDKNRSLILDGVKRRERFYVFDKDGSHAYTIVSPAVSIEDPERGHSYIQPGMREAIMSSSRNQKGVFEKTNPSVKGQNGPSSPQAQRLLQAARRFRELEIGKAKPTDGDFELAGEFGMNDENWKVARENAQTAAVKAGAPISEVNAITH